MKNTVFLAFIVLFLLASCNLEKSEVIQSDSNESASQEVMDKTDDVIMDKSEDDAMIEDKMLDKSEDEVMMKDDAMMDENHEGEWTDEEMEAMKMMNEEHEDSMMEEKMMDKSEDDAMMDGKHEDDVMEKEGVYTDYDESLLGATDNTVLFFHAAWCPSCRAADSAISAETIPSNLTIFKTDFDSETELRKKYGVVTQHTFVQIDADGNEINKWVWWNSVEDIEDRL